MFEINLNWINDVYSIVITIILGLCVFFACFQKGVNADIKKLGISYFDIAVVCLTSTTLSIYSTGFK